MKITLVISPFSCGGTERVISIMANYWAEVGHQVTVLTFESGNTSFYPLSNSVNWRALDIISQSSSWIIGLLNNMKRIYLIRKALLIDKPDYIISFVYITNILTILATRLSGCPLIISERNHPEHSREKRFVWHWLRRVLYPMAEHLVVQTREIRDCFHGFNKSICIIANPIEVAPKCIETPSEISLPPGRRIVAMGQLTAQKGFDLLLNVFARIHKAYREWNLIIIGTGSQREELMLQAERLGIKKYLYLPGRVINPFSVLTKCDLFVLSSRYEGFPNVLLEAMACGLPVVSFDCPSGPGEIIQHGVNGILVTPKDTAALERALYELIENKELRERLGNEAKKICERYAPDKIMKQWEELIYSNKNKSLLRA